jgi:O-antigen ligase
MRPAAPTKSAKEKKFSATEIYAAIFGLFLGLAIWKFGNPVILEQIIHPPANWQNFWNDAWPISWANILLIVITLIGAALLLANPFRWPASRWLWILPLIWLAWQFLSAARSEFHDLTTPTLWQYTGCVVCYFLGALVIGRRRGWHWLLVGVFAALTFCLVRAVDQKLFEFPRERQMLLESQQEGWTNMAPDLFLELKQNNVIINTNGVEVANPVIIAKYEKGRVSGTLVYPNALAGLVLLLLPAALAVVWQITRKLRPLVCFAAMGLSVFLGLAGLFWSGSKSGWLIALAMGAFWLLRLNWSRRLKWFVVIVLLVGGLTVFGLRFQKYFAKGATSVSARLDYWHAAARTAIDHPAFGTGPGTFQRPYARLKRPESEMARLVHNDYLEQFSDSGCVGGLTYLAWLGLLLWTLGRAAWKSTGWLPFAIFTGLLAWFIQGFMEFSLFIPALAWTAFTLAGCLLASMSETAGLSSARTRNEFDKPSSAV